jgi:hypothetical protein
MDDINPLINEHAEQFKMLQTMADEINVTTKGEVQIDVTPAGEGTRLEAKGKFEVLLQQGNVIAIRGLPIYQMIGTYEECFCYINGLRAMLQFLSSMVGGYDSEDS